jgi:hypothetical protein
MVLGQIMNKAMDGRAWGGWSTSRMALMRRRQDVGQLDRQGRGMKSLGAPVWKPALSLFFAICNQKKVQLYG